MPNPLYDTRTPRHDPPLLFAGQTQKERFINELAARVDALLHVAIEAELATPPSAPTDGQAWLVAPSPSGDWTGQAGLIAARTAGNWLFFAPIAGMTLLNKATGQQLRFVTAWQSPAKPTLPAGGSTIDTEARSTISAIVAAMVVAGIVPAN